MESPLFSIHPSSCRFTKTSVSLLTRTQNHEAVIQASFSLPLLLSIYIYIHIYIYIFVCMYMYLY